MWSNATEAGITSSTTTLIFSITTGSSTNIPPGLKMGDSARIAGLVCGYLKRQLVTCACSVSWRTMLIGGSVKSLCRLYLSISLSRSITKRSLISPGVRTAEHCICGDSRSSHGSLHAGKFQPRSMRLSCRVCMGRPVSITITVNGSMRSISWTLGPCGQEGTRLVSLGIISTTSLSHVRCALWYHATLALPCTSGATSSAESLVLAEVE